MPTFRIRTEFQEEAASLRLPQFCMKRADALLSGDFVVFKREALARDFHLRGCEYRINFTDSGNEVSKIDAQQDGNLALRPTDSAERRHYIERLQAFNPEAHLNVCKLEVFKLLDGDIDNLTSGDLKAYVENVVSVMDDDALDLLKSNPHECARQIQEKIQSLLDDHYQRAFFDLLDRNEIFCRPTWRFPDVIRPSESTTMYGLSLYDGEGGMNELEAGLVRGLLTLDNIRWWHRNLVKTGFRINGFINHYPDFLVMTKRGALLAVETKGEHLKGDDTEDKIRLGNAWRLAAGNAYRYYLVFRDGVTPPEGGCNMGKFLDQARGL